jgi:alpha-tubulin suppressor-like RCC1 family protein
VEHVQNQGENTKNANAGKRAISRGLIIGSAVVVAAIIIFLTVTRFIPRGKYKAAEELLNNEKYDEAIAAFSELGGFSDSAQRVEEAKEQRELKIKEDKYQNAVQLLKSGRFTEAKAAFTELGDFSDSGTMAAECDYQAALKLLQAGEIRPAIEALKSLGEYPAATEQLGKIYDEAFKDGDITTAFDAAAAARDFAGIAALRLQLIDNQGHVVALKRDGTVLAAGNDMFGMCDVQGWNFIVAVAAGSNHTVSIESNGLVHAVGSNAYGECDVRYWSDLIAIDAGLNCTIGLTKEGTVLATGDNIYGQCNVGDWTDIIAVDSGEGGFTVGLKADGTVVEAGNNHDGQCEVQGWTDMTAISAGWSHTVGLKSDGTVAAVGDNGDGSCDVQGWTDIIAVHAGANCTVGIKSDGTVEVTGFGKADWGMEQILAAKTWTDIVAVTSDSRYIIGLKADGTVVSSDPNRIPELAEWRDIGPAYGMGFNLNPDWD